MGLFPIITDNEKRKVILPAVSGTSDSDEAQEVLTLRLDTDNLSVSEASPFGLTFGAGGLVTDAKSGLHLSGDVDNREFVVISGLKRDDGGKIGAAWEDDYTKTYATGSLKFFVVSGDTLVPVTCEGMPVFKVSGPLPTFRIAVGDLNNDGYPAEVAIVTVSREDPNYYLYIYEISASGNGLAAKSIYEDKFSQRFGKSHLNHHYGELGEGAALAVGDFDGDKKSELACVYQTYNNDGWMQKHVSHVAAKRYRWNSTNVTFDKSNISVPQGYNPDQGGVDATGLCLYDWQDASPDPTNKYTLIVRGTFGLNIAVGRFEESITDQIMVQCYHVKYYETRDEYLYDNKYNLRQYHHGLSFYLLSPSGSRIFSRLSDSDSSLSYDGVIMAYCPNTRKYSLKDNFSPLDLYLPRVCPMTVGPFIKREKQFENNVDSVVYSYKNGDASKVVVIDEGKISRSYDVPGTQVGFLGSDFYGESFVLGDPIHFKINGRRNYVALMQVPPFHVDFIPQFWDESDKTTRRVANVSYSPETEVSYSRSDSDEKASEAKFSMNFSEEASTSHKISEEASSPSFIGIKASEEGSIEKSVSEASSNAVEYADSSTLSVSMSSMTATNFIDEAVYYGSTMHVWRYPVKKPIHRDFRGQIADSGDVDMYFTFTLCDEIGSEYNGAPGDYYYATHEEGNIFSYPTSTAGIVGYDRNKNSDDFR